MSTWQVALIIGIPIFALVGYVVYVRFSDQKKYSEIMQSLKLTMKTYLKEKRRLQKKADIDKEKIDKEVEKPFSIEAAKDLLNRRKDEDK